MVITENTFIISLYWYIHRKIYNNTINGNETITLGRNEDLVRIEEIKYVENISSSNGEIVNYNAYVPKYICEQEDLTGINHSEVSRIENGLKPKIDIIALIKICEVLDLDFEKLLKVTNYLVDEDYRKRGMEIIKKCRCS